ncbi:MAG: hypothetical protein H0W20_10595 [Chthoniobacterales bacterium]|nr:hypothetical protein [Chthoniobacterales bacterium]
MRGAGDVSRRERVGADQAAQTRPALLGQHRSSLVNVIDQELLLKRGQGDAILMFTCAIDPVGQGYGLQTYRESPGSGELKKHLLDRYQRALFVPALLHGRPQMVDVRHGDLLGDGRETATGDFPQPGRGRDKASARLYCAASDVHGGFAFSRNLLSAGSESSGAVAAAVDVDASGRVRGSSLISEHPPGLGFGAQVVGGIRDAVFIPGFRNGKPAACRFTMPVVFAGPGAQWKTGPRSNIVGAKGSSRTGYNFPANPKTEFEGWRRFGP